MGTFLGHLLERMNASKFQIFEIQVFVFNYSQISISQVSKNLGFLRFKGFSPDVIIPFENLNTGR